MTELRHKTPCSKCPFLRGSSPGWLGASTPNEFLDSTNSEIDMPCHSTIDYEDPNWEESLKVASTCAGSLIFMKNTCKMPRDEELAVKVQGVERDIKNVFYWAHEFLEHHRSVKLCKKR